MSEKLYAWLLRLLPSGFRREYGAEALQLFRDRNRDETGWFARLRLWLDLLTDLAASVPREYWRREPAVAVSATAPSAGVPSFFVFGRESPRFGALFSGCMLSVAGAVVFWILLGHGGVRLAPATARAAWPSRSKTPRSLQGGQEGALAKNGVSAGRELDSAERRRVVQAVAVNLKEHYVDSSIARRTADALLANEQHGDYDAVADGETFAGLLTTQMRDISHDTHLELIFSRSPLPNSSNGLSGERLARYRQILEQQNCAIERLEILPQKIGYLKLNSFPDPAICGRKVRAAMASLNGANAIIFDLRDNRGGDGGMVMLIAAYLFDHPEYIYSPRADTTGQSWTRSPVPTNNLADKPAYILTSRRTFSAAEHFSYNMKMLRRATLVGETTGGATDVGVFHRIDDHFGMGIRETRGINPYSEPDWAVVGVTADVKVNAAKALQTAIKLAQEKLRKR